MFRPWGGIPSKGPRPWAESRGQPQFVSVNEGTQRADGAEYLLLNQRLFTNPVKVRASTTTLDAIQAAAGFTRLRDRTAAEAQWAQRRKPRFRPS